MKIFTVIMTDDFMKRIVMEHYSILETALTRACQWCHECYGVNGNHNPEGQNSGDGSTIEYVVFRGEEEDVFVSVLELELLTAIPHFKGQFFTQGGDLSGTCSSQTVAAIVAPADDPEDPTLPAGWDLNGNPIRMEALLQNPDNVMATGDLTPAQQWALTIARVSKRPNFSWKTTQGVFVQSSALHELKNKTSIGYDIKEAEMDYLDLIRETNTVVDVADDYYDNDF